MTEGKETMQAGPHDNPDVAPTLTPEQQEWIDFHRERIVNDFGERMARAFEAFSANGEKKFPFNDQLGAVELKGLQDAGVTPDDIRANFRAQADLSYATSMREYYLNHHMSADQLKARVQELLHDLRSQNQWQWRMSMTIDPSDSGYPFKVRGKLAKGSIGEGFNRYGLRGQDAEGFWRTQGVALSVEQAARALYDKGVSLEDIQDLLM